MLFLEHVPDRPGAGHGHGRGGAGLAADGRASIPSRDIPQAVRAGGFTSSDLDRFTIPTLAVPLRRWVAGVGVARRAPETEDQ